MEFGIGELGDLAGSTMIHVDLRVDLLSQSPDVHFCTVHKIGKIVCSRAQVEQSHLHSAGSAFIAWSAVISVARLSGHTGLKLSIRRLALYTRQHLLAVPPIVVAIGEVANSRVRLYLSIYLSIATTSIHLPPPTAGVFTRPSVRAAIARATRPSQT